MPSRFNRPFSLCVLADSVNRVRQQQLPLTTPTPQQQTNSVPVTVPLSLWPPALYGAGAKLNSDAINYLHRIYCRECRMEEQRKTDQQPDIGNNAPGPVAAGDKKNNNNNGSSNQKPKSPPVVESLQQAMDKNKECKYLLSFFRDATLLFFPGILFFPPGLSRFFP